MDRTLVVIFGGMDSERVDQYGLTSLTAGKYHGEIDTSAVSNVEPDELLATLITGRPPEEHGVSGSMHFTNPTVRRFDSKLPDVLVSFRRWIYDYLSDVFNWFDCRFRRWVAADLECDTLFEVIPQSKPLFIPSYNPEPQWCIYRNTIRPHEYPDLGETGARELIEKNLHWRQHNVEKALEGEDTLIVAHFQFIDSIQHVYEQNLKDSESVEEAYRRADKYAGELRDRAASAGIKNILFMSEHGRPHPSADETHYQNTFFNSTWDFGTRSPRIEDMHDSIIEMTN